MSLPLFTGNLLQDNSEKLSSIVDEYSSQPKKLTLQKLSTLAQRIKEVVPTFTYTQSDAEAGLKTGLGNCIARAEITARVGRTLGFATYRHIEAYHGSPHNSTLFLDKSSGEIYELDYLLHSAQKPLHIKRGTQYSSRSLSRLASSMPKVPFVAVDANPHGTVLYTADELAASFAKDSLRKDVILDDMLATEAIDSVFATGVLLPRGSDLQSRLFIGSVCSTAAQICKDSADPNSVLS